MEDQDIGVGLSADTIRGWQDQLASVVTPASGVAAEGDVAAEREAIVIALGELRRSSNAVLASLGSSGNAKVLDATDPAFEALAAAGRLQQIDWNAVPKNDLPTAAALVARTVRCGEAALLAAAGRLEATGAAEELGWATAKDFLTHVIGGYAGTGGGLVRLAGQVADLPELAGALEAGRVSIPQARAIARQVGTLPRDEGLRSEATAEMLRLADTERLNATDLDRRFTDVVKTIDPDGTRIGDDRTKEKQERGAHNARFFGGTPDGLGGVKIKGYSTVEDWETLSANLAPFAAPHTTEPGACGGDPDLFRKRDEQGRRLDPGCPDPMCAHDGRDPRDHGQRSWDALMELCDRAAAATFVPGSHGVKTRLFVAVNAEDVVVQQEQPRHDNDDHSASGDPRPEPGESTPAAGADETPAPAESRRRLGYGQLLPGDSLSITAVRRLACDSEFVRVVLGPNGEILDVGRAHRLVTPGIWNALVFRDRHCSHPGCKVPHYACDAHHVIHWIDGGKTCLINLVLLCRRHHMLVHNTPWRIVMDPVTGRPIWHPPARLEGPLPYTYVPATGPPVTPGSGRPNAA